MNKLSVVAELVLEDLVREFSCELANHGINSEHVQYPTAREATLAMLRQAYLYGQDSMRPGPDFEADLARVAEANQKSSPRT